MLVKIVRSTKFKIVALLGACLFTSAMAINPAPITDTYLCHLPSRYDAPTKPGTYRLVWEDGDTMIYVQNGTDRLLYAYITPNGKWLDGETGMEF